MMRNNFWAFLLSLIAVVIALCSLSLSYKALENGRYQLIPATTETTYLDVEVPEPQKTPKLFKIDNQTGEVWVYSEFLSTKFPDQAYWGFLPAEKAKKKTAAAP